MKEVDLGPIIGPRGFTGATGPQGPQGPAGPTGPQGPNTISAMTQTAYNGVLLGDGSKVVNRPFNAVNGVASYENAESRVPLIGKGINLLDNWYFVGGGSQQGGEQFPINQRRQTSYNGFGITGIDRWRQDYGLTINSDCITTTSVIYQAIDVSLGTRLIGKTVTASVLKRNGELITGTITFDASYATDQTVQYTRGIAAHIHENRVAQLLRIESGDYIAAKVELGPTQTLAHQENGVWVLNDPPPNFQQELAKCQRYYTEVNCYPYTSNIIYSYFQVGCYFPVTMRTTPSVVVCSENTNAIGGVGDFLSGGDFSGVNVRIGTCSMDGVSTVQITDGILPSGMIAALRFRASADL